MVLGCWWGRDCWCCEGCGVGLGDVVVVDGGLGCYGFVVCYEFPCFGIGHTKRGSRLCGVFVFTWCAILWQGERGVVVV